MTTVSKSKTSVINVSISDLVLTPVSCALLANEVMKNLLYQRSQIPYPYAWLKSVVQKKRQRLDDGEKESENFTVNKHFKTVSTVYDSAESIMKNIIEVCKDFGEELKEIMFLIGITPVCPKEIITVKFSSIAYGHTEGNHASENGRKQPKILRSIFLENSWMDLIQSPLTCGNTYIFVKLGGDQDSWRLEDSIFAFSKAPLVPPSVKHTIINLNYNKTEEHLCCNNLEIFKDANDQTDTCVKKQFDNNGSEFWLQSKVFIRGFRDCFINKVSACQLW